MKATPRNILSILELIDWGGHVELPIGDLQWLAAELAVRLGNSNMQVCDSCNKARAIVISTALGPMCDDCIRIARKAAYDARLALEDEV